MSETTWTVRGFEKNGGNWFSVESSSLYVDFMEAWCWTIRNIKYFGHEIAGEYGAHGSVVRMDSGPGPKDYYYIGTSHGHETVKAFTLLVDGEEQAVAPGAQSSGRDVVVRKQSNLGPLDHEAVITFPATGDRLVVKHSYRVVEDLSEGFSFLFALMFELNKLLDRWLAVTADGEDAEGMLPSGRNGQLSIQRDVKAVILYGHALKTGVRFTYPEIYRGAELIQSEIPLGASSHFGTTIVDRKDDNKLYFRPEVKGMDYRVGDTFEYGITVVPFRAEPDEWRDRGRSIDHG